MTAVEPPGQTCRTGGGSMDADAIRLFSLDRAPDFGEGVAASLGLKLEPIEERIFDDGEHKLRPLARVSDRDVYLLHALDGESGRSVNDKLCRLCFFVATLRDQGAGRITVVASYLPYARKDRRTSPGDPVTSRYVAELLEAVGVDRIAALEVHNPAAFENAFRCPTEHLDARRPLAEAVRQHVGGRALALVSPDAGGVKRAAALREVLAARTDSDPASAFLEKYRSDEGVTGEAIVGDVGGRAAVVIDDMVATGTTMRRAIRACREQGADPVIAAITHGVFTPGAEALLEEAQHDRLLVTDSVAPRLRERWDDRVELVSVQSLFADAVAALHAGESVAEAIAP